MQEYHDPDQLKSLPLREVQLTASVLLKIMKHCRDHTVTGNGQLLGMELNGVLQISHCFPVSTKTSPDDEIVNEIEDAEYQLNMMRNLRQLNYDANAIGWYQSTYLGSHWNQMLIETQYEYQKALEHAVVLMYDPTQTYHGAVAIKAMRLRDSFMKLFANKKFSMEILAKNKLNPEDIFEYLPIRIRNSNLSHALLYHLEELSGSPLKQTAEDVDSPAWSFKSNLPQEISAASPSFELLEQRSNYFLEKHMEYLGETIDEWGQEQWRWHGWHRNLAKEQQKLASIASKRRYENEKRAAKGLPQAYNEDDLEVTSFHLKRLLNNEPSRLETLVIHNQLSTYCNQVESFSSTLVAKMQGIRALEEVNLRKPIQNTTSKDSNASSTSTPASVSENITGKN